jgi:hypothetical protein
MQTTNIGRWADVEDSDVEDSADEEMSVGTDDTDTNMVISLRMESDGRNTMVAVAQSTVFSALLRRASDVWQVNTADYVLKYGAVFRTNHTSMCDADVVDGSIIFVVARQHDTEQIIAKQDAAV